MRSRVRQWCIRGGVLVVSIMLLVDVLCVLAVTEEWTPPCRWDPPGYYVLIHYKWGDNLQYPGSAWRNAFEAAIADWQSHTKAAFYYTSSGSVTFNTYWADDGAGGHCHMYCNGSVMTGALAEGNLYPVMTQNQRQAYGAHETGHTLGLGHLSQGDGIAIMGYNPDGNVYYTVRQPDIDYINQVYP